MSESPKWHEISDSEGFGYFLLQITEGENIHDPEKIKALAGVRQAFVEERFKANAPIVAYRCGGMGMSAIRVNPDLIYVKEMKKLVIGDYPKYELEPRRVDPKNFNEAHYVDVTMMGKQTVFSMKGTTKGGLPFKAEVIFQPSVKAPPPAGSSR